MPSMSSQCLYGRRKVRILRHHCNTWGCSAPCSADQYQVLENRRIELHKTLFTEIASDNCHIIRYMLPPKTRFWLTFSSIYGLPLSIEHFVRALVGLKNSFYHIISWMSNKPVHSSVCCLFCHFIVSRCVWDCCVHLSLFNAACGCHNTNECYVMCYNKIFHWQ